MATLLAHIRVHRGMEAEFESVARELFDRTADEKGKRRYEYWRSADSGLYYCLLAFDDFHAFLAHQTSDHHESASGDLRRLIEDMRLESIDPVQGASELPATAMQELPADADELTARYHSLFAVKLADWWSALRSD